MGQNFQQHQQTPQQQQLYQHQLQQQQYQQWQAAQQNQPPSADAQSLFSSSAYHDPFQGDGDGKAGQPPPATEEEFKVPQVPSAKQESQVE